MVARQRHHHAPPDLHLVAVGDGHATNGADGQDGALGRIDDCGKVGDVEHAEVGDGKRRARHLARLQLPRPRPLGEVTRLHGDLTQRLGLTVAQHGRDQSVVQCDGDTDVGAVPDANRVTLERRVHFGMLEQRERAGADDEVVHGDLGRALQRVQVFPQRPRAIHRDFRSHVEVRHRRLAERHSPGDRRPDLGERPIFVFGAGETRHRASDRRRRRRRLDVAPDDAPTGAAAMDHLQIDTALGRDLLGKRRGLHTATGSGRRRRGGRCRLARWRRGWTRSRRRLRRRGRSRGGVFGARLRRNREGALRRGARCG